MRRVLLAIGAAILLAAGLSQTASAAGGPPSNPPPPRRTDEASLQAWADAYVVENEFVLSGFADGSAILFDPATVALQDGHVSAIVRGEMFKPERILGVTQRSFRDRWLFDCAARTAKEVFSEGFPQSNLQGQPVPVDVSDAAWSPLPEETGEGRLMAQVCSLGSLLGGDVDRSKALPPNLDDVTDEATAAWMSRHVDLGRDVMVWAGTGVGVFYTPAEVGKAESGRPLLWLRTELSVLLPSEKSMWRSMRDQLELDCLNQRYLRLRQEIYPGSNLLGAKSEETMEPEWAEAEAGSTDAAWLGSLCRRLAGGADAAPPVPAPAGGDPQARIDWIDTYINTNGYVLASTTDEGALFYGTRDMQLGDGGHLLAVMRFEHFGGGQTPTDGPRSLTQSMEFDCRGGRQRVLATALYAENNLGGARVRGPAGGWAKPKPNTAGEAVFKQLCSQVSLLGPDSAGAMPTPLRGSSDAAIEAWIDDNVVAGDYEISGYGDEAAALYSTSEIERTRQDHMRVWTRVEFFRPDVLDNQVVRSLRELVEFDCDQQRSRTLATELFPGANLTGAKIEEKKSEAEWSFNSPGGLLSLVANDVCRIKDEADEDAADPAKALPTSSGIQAL